MLIPILPVILFVATWLLFNPVMSMDFIQLPFLVAVCSGLWVFLAFAFSEGDGDGWDLQESASSVLLAVSVSWVLLGLVSSSPVFRAESYRNLLGPVETVESSSSGMLERVSDPKHIRTVDIETARAVMGKKLWEVQALWSQFDVGDPDIQRVGSGLYWVAPLEYLGFFKYASAGPIPAYVKVSVSDQSDVELVTSYGSGTKVAMVKSPSAYFMDSLGRHAYFNGGMSVGTTDYSFEIDDSGKPYWVITTYSHAVGFSGNDADGVIVVDPSEGGETKRYTLKDVPDWVDRVQPESFVADQIDDWGEYIHGWANPSNKDRLKLTTQDLRLTYGTDWRPYWYAGIANYSSNGGSVNGFMLVDTITKKATFHKEPGASEDAARKSAEGKVQQMGYVSTNPVLYSVAGIPTYVMALKDKSGLMKQVAFVSVKDYSTVVTGDSAEEAYKNYRNVLSKSSSASAPGPGILVSSWSGKAKRVSQFVSKGESYSVLQVASDDGKTKSFVGNVESFRELALTRDGDSVTVGYSEDDLEKEAFRISSFSNAAISPKQ